MEVVMNKLKNLFAKIKSVKNIEIYVAVLLGIVVVSIVLIGNFSTKNVDEKVSSESYIAEMEHKIVSVIQKIDGVGKVEVAITHDATNESVYAYESGTNNILYVKGQPVIIKTLPPKILGVVVVAEGADNPIVRMKINEAVITLLDVDENRVQVFTHKS